MSVENQFKNQTQSQTTTNDRLSSVSTESTDSLFYDRMMNSSETQSNEHYQQIFEETLQEFSRMPIELKWNMDTYDKGDPLATTTNTNTQLIKEIQIDIENSPVYLTKQNPLFQQMIDNLHSTLRITTASINIDQTNNKECIRQIGLLIYKMMIIQTYHALWSTYLKSGLGQLITTITNEQQISYQTNIPIWPKEVKALLLATSNIQIKDIDYQHYLNFVRQQLHLLDCAANLCRRQLNILANHFHGYSLQIQNILQSYIDEHSCLFRMKTKHQIELVHYDYHIRALKLEYLRHRPNQFQQQLLKEICQNKYERAISEHQYQFIRQQIDRSHNSFNKIFQNSSFAQTISTCMDSHPSMDDHIRQQLFPQFRTIVDQARYDLFELYTNVLEDERKISGKKYDESLKKLWSTDPQTMPTNMTQIIIQRCTKIDERIDCIYKFKTQSNLS